MATRQKTLLVVIFLGLIGCHGPGPYGHAPRYVPSDAETRALAGARPYDLALAQRHPDAWRRSAVELFGVVEGRFVGDGGRALLKLGIRALDDRNACARPEDDDSCRVTVKGGDLGVVWALVALRADDDVGPAAVAPRSLLRIVGAVSQETSREDGAPVIRAAFYRHWPASEYVASAAAPCAAPCSSR